MSKDMWVSHSDALDMAKILKKSIYVRARALAIHEFCALFEEDWWRNRNKKNAK